MSKSSKGLIIHIEDLNDPDSVLVTWNGEPVGHIDQLRLAVSGKTMRCNIAQVVSPGMLKSVTRASERMRAAGVKTAVRVAGRDPKVDELARRSAP